MQAVPANVERIADRLAGKHLLVTGSTGFLAKAFVEKLLRSVPTVGGIHLLVRPRPDGTSPRDRVMREVLASSAFDRLRASLGERFAALCEEKIHVVGGDLTRERMGMSAEEYARLAQRIDVVVNSAATVTFDERLDLALELNTEGPSRLLEFARDAGNIPFLHVSTCYVCGVRRGEICEDMTAPESARESLPRRTESGKYDLDGLIELVRAEAMQVRHRFGADTEMCRRELTNAGMRLARRYGWNDTYTFTKWLGEQLLARDRGEVPLVILRPAIIESGLDEPAPGWIDGLRMADPIIVAYGRGKLNDFPASPDIAIDIIPVDFVVNAMIATLPLGAGRSGDFALYQCASSDRHALRLGDLIGFLEEAFRKRPMIDETGRPIRPGSLRCVDMQTFLEHWRRREQQLQQLRRLISVFATARRDRKFNARLRQIEQIIYFAEIYAPYTHLDVRFCVDNLDAAAARLHPDDRIEFPFDPTAIDWRGYVVDRHVPGLRSFVLGAGDQPGIRIRAAAIDGTPLPTRVDTVRARTLFELLEHSAQRWPEKAALQVRREGRWVRYTYRDAVRATGTIMRRFLERGLAKGDRIALCAENMPEWGLVYMAAMRAGMTVIALDPQLPPADAWAAARFAGAKLMCAGPSTRDGLQSARRSDDPAVVLITEPFVPRPGASLDELPDPVPVREDDLASILFTSGTTVAPKAVQLTHRNFIANTAGLLKVQHVGPVDEFLSVLPLYHAFEFTGGLLSPLAAGATITYVDQLRGPEITAAMQATGTTIMLVVPRLLKMFHDGIEGKVAASGWFSRRLFGLLKWLSDVTGHRLGRLLFARVHRGFGGRLRMLVSGGASLDPELQRSFMRMGFEAGEGYGMTETAPVLTVNPPGAVRPGSVGVPLPDVRVEIRNPNLEGVGEVWVQGPNVTQGYLHNEAATHELLADGWLRTGDLGRLDADGYLYLTGRSKDLIITAAGKNVYPDEVEVRYKDLPYTKELCVLAMPSTDGVGEAVHAVVVLDLNAAPDLDRSSLEREVRAAAELIAAELPTHQRIGTFHFWDRELPKTSTLKAKRNVVREMLLSADVSAGTQQAPKVVRPEAAPAATPQDARTLATVRTILAKHAKRPPESVGPDMHLLLDLGIDSIGKIDVIGDIEGRFGFSIDDDTAAKIARVSDLLAVIGDRAPTGAARETASRWRRLTGAAVHGAANGRLPAPLVPMRWLVRGSVGAFMHTYVRVQAEGLENLPEAGPFVLAPNHCSHLDAPSVLTAIGGRRRVWVAGAEDYFFTGPVRRFVFGKLLDTIAFDRQADGVQGLRRCAEALERGDGLLLFPEGTRSRTGRLQPFKIGIAVLAIEKAAPIVPVHIDHAYDLLPKGGRWIRPGTIRVRFGVPIAPPALGGDADHYAAFCDLTQRVQSAVQALGAGA